MRFDLSLSRESAVDKATGRVGADPAAIVKAKANDAAPAKPAKQGLFGSLFGR